MPSDLPADLRAETAVRIGELDALFEKLLPLIRQYEMAGGRPDTKVVEFKSPEDLRRLFPMALPEQGQGIDKAVAAINDMMLYSVRTSHPRFMNQLFAGSDPIGQIAELVTAILNVNCYTYTVAPVFSMMEVEVMQRMADLAGFDVAESEGIMVPGGSYANLVGLITARHHHFPHVRLEGWRGDERPVIFTSAQAHYSIRRNAMVLGLGMNAVVAVAADRSGHMLADDLVAKIAEARAKGQTPFAVSATAGTTIMGGFDDFNALADICQAENLWLHVDGAWGGACLLSDRLRSLMKGVERADSLAWDAHKGLGVPVLAAGILLNKHKGLLRASNNSSADYLFHPSSTSEYDLGDMTLQCGRRADSIKVWLSWYYHGRAGLGARVEHAYDVAQYLHRKICKDPRFLVVAEPEYCNVTFWYLPKCLRGTTAEDIEANYERLDQATQRTFVAMQQAGTMMFNFNPLTDLHLPRFFRLITNSPVLQEKDMDFVIEELDRLAEDIVV
ncbi:uncharacterized protein MONBRDRAFT_19231 [Monosiga brevicollis MX1]|uniref:Glutamate decarboxylase n=1 Tax=Monosiga brevicollis TaxID=81824 RepID=A9UQ78_MONBE|nr:uncharacterized protein MONBRDRAFT_19231 [Monosiga brevicollis MX1]EDQ93000.1 predicted protein [Monosiga brevicollis MX1]|eukprot:XP_001742762.1 hypothetical protein [Monosiga brevicollis MX1]